MTPYSQGSPEQPSDAPFAATVVVVAAFLVGVGAVGASSVLSSAWLRVLLALALVGVGLAVTRLATVRDFPVSLVLGERLLRGVGTSITVLGAYLLGLALLTTPIPSSPVSVVLLVYGIPALALLALATTGMRAWSVGAGAILPMLTVLLLVTSGATSAVVSVTMLVAAVALTFLVLLAPAARWAKVALPAAAMAASFAFGSGASPFGSLGATQLGGAMGEGTSGALTGDVRAVLVAVALLVAVVVLLLAVVRRDLASGVLAGSLFAAPPILLWGEPWSTWPGAIQTALVAVPALTALVASAAIRSYRFRRGVVAGLTGGRRGTPGAPPADPGASDAASAAACAVVVAAAAVAFVVVAMPVLGWGPLVQGVVVVLVLVAAGALAYWLPNTPGASAAVVALLGLALASPWVRLVGGGGAEPTDLVVSGVVDLAVALTLGWLLVRRHRRVAVAAAAAYTIAGSAAAFLGALLLDEAEGGYLPPFGDEWAPVVIVALPLVLLAVPAAAVAFGQRAPFGQAIGAVAVAAAGFLPMKTMVGEFGAAVPNGYALRMSLSPLTPTDWLMVSTTLRDISGPALVAVLAMVLVAFVLVASLARRPSAPLAAATAVLLLASVQASLLTALSEWSADEAETLGWVLGAVALLAAAVAVVAAGSAVRRRPIPSGSR